MDYGALMDACLVEARLARDELTEPVGSVIATPSGTIIWKGRNRVRSGGDQTAHAEVDVIRAAGTGLLDPPPAGWVLATSAEPCLMCLGAILVTPIAEVVWATALLESAFASLSQTKYASARLSTLRVAGEPSLSHRDESRALLQTFYETADPEFATRLKARYHDGD